MPVHGDAAAVHVVKPGQQLAQGALAAAGGPHQGHRLPGGDVQRHMVQHLGLLSVGKGHVVHVHVALDVPQLPGVGGVLDGRLGAHQLHEPVQPGEAVREHLGEVGQLADGADEGGDVQGEGDQVHIVHLLVHDEPAACGDHRHRQDAVAELHHRVEAAHLLVKAALGGLEHLVGPVKALLLGLLVGEGLGGADAGQSGLNGGVDGAGLGLGGAGGGAHLLPPPQGHGQQHREQHQQHQRQLPAQDEHHRQRAQNGHQRDEQVLRPMVGQLRQLEQVVGQAAHQLAGAVAVVEVKAQLLDVVIEVPAYVGLHPDAEGVAPVGHHEVQRRAQEIRRHHRSHDDEEHPELPLGQPGIHGRPRHQRERQVDAGDEKRAGQVQGKQPPMGLEIGDKYPQGAAGPIVFCGHSLPHFIFWAYSIPYFRPFRNVRRVKKRCKNRRS